MFKALGIIESFGTGIGEAKRSMRENGSPDLYYKIFDVNDNITSVVIPVNEEYYDIKNGTNPNKKVWIERETKDFKHKILESGFSNKDEVTSSTLVSSSTRNPLKFQGVLNLLRIDLSASLLRVLFFRHFVI